MFSSESWILGWQVRQMAGAWMGFPVCLAELNWQSTPQWSVLCTGEGPGVALEAARRRKERRYPELVGPTARSRLVVFGVEVGAVGRGNPKTSSANWPEHVLDRNSRSSAVGPNRLGASVGVPWCHVWWHGQWQIRCWVSLLGADGVTPLVQDVERDLLAAGFAW